MNNNLIFFLVGSLLFFMIIFQLVLSYLVRKTRFKKRLRNFDLLVMQTNELQETEEKQPKKKLLSTFIKRAGKQFDGNPKLSKWGKVLTQANSEFSPGQFQFFRFLCLLTFIMAGLVLRIYPLLLIPLGVIGYWLPVFTLKKKVEKRLNRCSYQLAEALGTMANSMRAGFSFMQAMKLISEEFPDPIGPEFEKTLLDISYGIPVEEAFMRMLERLPDKELEMAVKAMLIQRMSGGNLAVLLETVQETVSGRVHIKDEIKTLTAQGKLSSWIITGLPICLGLYLKLANPEYFNLLLKNPLGMVMLSMAIIGILMGWIFIRKIVRIEV